MSCDGIRRVRETSPPVLTAMVSVADLLNPEPPRAPLPASRPRPLSPAHQTVPFRHEPSPVRPQPETLRMAENSRNLARSRPRAAVCFPPFENLDEASLLEVRRFQVHPFGSIRDTRERIPYNSGKKDFFSKTGREGFEAFHYDFKVPGDDNTYTVMWDYSVGLVRMTSFFKCRGYSKTTPAKMLNMNPGLKDITHSITGGSIKAQGYWMPYACARAVCATFCHKIAGALIPLFGPQFPSECIPDKALGHGRMKINPEIVALAKSEAVALFRPSAGLPSPRSSRSASPLPSQRSARILDPHDYHSDYDRRLLLSPYTDTDVDYRPASEQYSRRAYAPMPPMRIPTSRPHIPPAAAPTPLHSPGWTAVNHPQNQDPPGYHHRSVSHLHEELLGLNVSATANPWLSAIPRSPTPGGGSTGTGTGRWQQPYPPPSHRHHHPHPSTSPPSTSLPERGITLPPIRLKRQFDQVDNPRDTHSTGGDADDDDRDYDAGESRASSVSASPLSVAAPSPTPTPAPASQQQQAARPFQSNHTPCPSEPSPLHPAGGGGGGGGGGPRHESERNAAMMLMHMRARSEDGGSSSSDSSKEGGGRRRSSPGEEGCRGDMEGVAVESTTCTGTGRRLSRDSAEAAAARLTSPTSTLLPSGREGAGVGPVTRAKRRRTYER
ncbi:hypothetical protein N658DRAFT_105658 [Parathielavia hyrcaniae]|uniref:HTH APSES-type domain-containing protein n=1 Tax=Parathielavia hyrcaniae TaxID=113614 RepID=A0AAN6PYR7_9PEZI|nr:hypothetical protein N658DRAFT_105658 [Parathielavia hyrcaniae]